MLEVSNLTVRYGRQTIVDGVSFSLSPGQWLMVAGPNGAGKSTIINAISQGVPYTGKILYRGEDMARFTPRRLARAIGVLAQRHSVGYPFTVAEVAALGRYSYRRGMFYRIGAEDRRLIEKALELTGMLPYASQPVVTLSGGELQRTFLAQVFAQNPDILILDEPANHLDIAYQKQIFELIRDWTRESRRAVLSAAHDLSIAKAYGTDAILLNAGRLVAAGKADDALKRENLEAVYSVDVYKWMRGLLSQWEGDKT